MKWHTRLQVLDAGLPYLHEMWLPVETCFNCNSKNLVFAYDDVIGYEVERVKCIDCNAEAGGAMWWADELHRLS